MIFNIGDRVKIIDKNVFTFALGFIKDGYLTEGQKKRFKNKFDKDDDFRFEGFCTILGYGLAELDGINDTQVVFIENKFTKSIYAVREKDLRFYSGSKVYNIPNYEVYDDISRIIVKGRTVKVILKDGAKGKSICHESDKFNEELGVEIAYYRALANSLGGRKGKF